MHFDLLFDKNRSKIISLSLLNWKGLFIYYLFAEDWINNFLYKNYF